MAAVGIALGMAAAGAVSETTTQLPPFGEIEAIISSYFNSLKNYKSGDLINQGDVQVALDRIEEEAGWIIAGRSKLEGLALPQKSFLVRELAKPEGRKFMRNIATYEGGYNRLDQLSTIDGGEQLIRTLIKGPGGDELIEYMATTKQGKNLGQMAAQTQHGVNLNKSTGHIYTEDELVHLLKKLYQKMSPAEPSPAP